MMKKFFAFNILFFAVSIFCSSISSREHENLLAIVIMVKNEADVIIPTLKPFIDAGIQSFLVYDTGSTDGTQQKIHHYFTERTILDAHIIEEPFVDFGTSRSKALDYADQLFPETTFLLMLDAEWYIHNVDELLNFCKAHQHYITPGFSGSCYLMHLFTREDSIDNYVIRLIRRGCNVRYHGPVHETISDNPSGLVPKSVYFEYDPKNSGKQKSKERFKRDYDLLKKAYEDNPTNMRTLFYLGQTCQFLQDWELAIHYYQKRLDLGEISEEKYLAAYRIGYAIEYILEGSNQGNSIQKYRWEDALYYYLKAHQMLPHRAEPLFRIACHYIRHNEHATAYLFAIRAAQLPFPCYDTLFVEKKIYDYLRYDILGQCAIYAGEISIGKQALLKAMEIEPDNSCLHYNLAIYNQYDS